MFFNSLLTNITLVSIIYLIYIKNLNISETFTNTLVSILCVQENKTVTARGLTQMFSSVSELFSHMTRVKVTCPFDFPL